MYKDITGILLAGGKSSRMGVNKSFLEYKGKYIVQHMHDKLSSLFGKIIIITNTRAEYEFLGSEIHEDIYKGKGPLGGIHSGLINSQTENNFILSCDIPLITNRSIEFIINYPSNKKIKVPYADGYVQQLCGIYSRSLLPEIEIILNGSKSSTSKCKVLNLVEETRGEIINIEKEMPGYEKNEFLNLNNKSDYILLQNISELRDTILK